jgi:hypothetical protein
MSKPRIGLVITPEGVESVTYLCDKEHRKAANGLCALLGGAIDDFSETIVRILSNESETHKDKMS